MTASTDIALHTASLVRRARAGDENAMGLITRVGQEARKGNNPRAQAAFAALKEFIDKNPAQDFVLGAEPVIMDPPSPTAIQKAVPDTEITVRRVDPELRKPPVPRGLFDRLFDPEYFALVIIRACQYRNGLPAAAALLAAGPALTNPVVHQLGLTNFGSEESTACFFHGVKFSSEASWDEVAPHLDPPLRRCLAIGQCVGRARKIQAVRQPNSSISAYSPVAGWELGE